MDKYSIRIATENDVERLTEIIMKYRTFHGVETQDILLINDFIAKRIMKCESKIFLSVEVSSDAVVGFIQLYPSFSTVSLKPQWILNDFFVQDSERKKGIGTLLMDAVKEYFKDNAKGFILVTDKTNEVAKRFYAKHGWTTDVYDFYTYTL